MMAISYAASSPLEADWLMVSFIVVEEEIEADMEVPGDERTAKIILEIGNSVSEFINLTAYKMILLAAIIVGFYQYTKHLRNHLPV